MEYINFGTKKINNSDDNEVIRAYQDGYVLTRIDMGFVVKVRSIRVNLEKFSPTSENKRILKKFKHVIRIIPLPLKQFNSDILIIAKKFYDTKFGKDTFSSAKIKELLTTKSNFNVLLCYELESKSEGYCFARIIQNDQKIIHYAYPFYSLEKLNTNFGMYMMTLAVKEFKDHGFKYFYLGSCHDPKCRYKLQFKGIEWFNEVSNIWEEDLNKLKSILENKNTLKI